MNPWSALGIAVIAGVIAIVLLNESEKTAWNQASTKATKAMTEADRVMAARPDQRETILRGMMALNQARLSQKKTWLGNYDATKLENAIMVLQRAIAEAQAAPKRTAPPATGSSNTGCFDRYGPIPGCK